MKPRVEYVVAECSLKWAMKHSDHAVTNFKQTVYTDDSEEVKYDCYICSLCKDVARVEIGRKKVDTNDCKPTGVAQGPKGNRRSAKKHKKSGKKAVFKFNCKR